MGIVMVSPAEAVVRQFTSKSAGDTRTNVHYFGKWSGREIGPEAYVVEVRNRTLGAHFHDADQFQVLLGGPGAFYKTHAVPSVMLHYADAYTAYGPLIGAADPPLRFFTLRADPTDFVAYVPKDKDKLVYRGKRQGHFALDREAGAAEPGEQVLIADDTDGLSAVVIRAKSGERLPMPGTGNSNGQFVYVVSGVVEWEGREYGPESLGWQPADEQAHEMRCVEDCQVAAMRFPRPATNPKLSAA